MIYEKYHVIIFTNKQQEELRKELDDNYSMVHNY